MSDTVTVQQDSQLSPTTAQDRRAWVAAAALGLGGFAAALVLACLRRGPFYDEFYTAVVTAHDRPFLTALTESWLADNHPPLFYLLAWAAQGLTTGIEAARLLNLGLLAATVAAGWLIVRGSAPLLRAAALMALIVAADLMTLRVGSEFRSYFLSLCASAIIMLVLAKAWLQQGLPRIGDRLALMAALLIGFNTHIITSLVMAAMLVPFLAIAAARRQFALGLTLAVPATISGLVLVGTAIIQLPRWQANTAQFWLPPGLEIALRSLQYTVQRAVEGNLLLALLGMVGGAWLILTARRERRMPRQLETILLLGAGVVLAGAILTGLHAWRPMISERYLTALIPPLALAIGLAASAAIGGLAPVMRTAALACAAALTLYALLGNFRTVTALESWKGSANLVAMVQRGCPDTAVHIDPAQWNAYTFNLPPADNRRVLPAAYRMMADARGVRLEPAASRRVSSTCPTLFWAEHDTLHSFDRERILRHLRASGFKVQTIHQYRSDFGWVAANRPLAGAAVSR